MATNSNKIDIASHTRNTGTARNGTWTVALTNGANINYTTVWWKTTWNVWWKDYTDAREAVNAAKLLNAESAPAINYKKGNFVDPAVQQAALNWENVAEKFWNAAVKALDQYNKTYNNVTDEDGNKVETATTDELTGNRSIKRQAKSTSTDNKWNFTSDYWDGSTSTTDVYWNTKVNKDYVDNNIEARRQAESAAQSAQTDYAPETNAYTSSDMSQLNDNISWEYQDLADDQDAQNEKMVAEILQDENKAASVTTLADELGVTDLDSDAADYDDVDTIINQSSYTSRVIDDQPFDWWESREEPDYWEASRMWEQPAIYDKEIEEHEEKKEWPLTNKKDRDTTRIGRHW